MISNNVKPSIESHQVEEFLSGHFGEKISDVIPVGQGEWSQAFSFHRAIGYYIIRFAVSAESFEKDSLAAKFSSPNLPIPRIYEIGQSLGLYFAISKRVIGNMLDELDTSRMSEIVPAVFTMLDSVRLVNLDHTDGYGDWNSQETAPYPSWREFLLDIENDHPTSKIHGWRNSMAVSPVGSEPFDIALNYLKEHIHKCSEDRHLVHTDLLHYNVLVSENHISAVIDWGNSIYGDFLYDLANFSFWSFWYPSMRGIDWAREAHYHYQTIGLDVPNLDERLRCYEVHIGLAGMAWNSFKKNWTELKATTERTLNSMK